MPDVLVGTAATTANMTFKLGSTTYHGSRHAEEGDQEWMHIQLLCHSRVEDTPSDDSALPGIRHFKHGERPWIAQLIRGET
jgi:hypothetical protein